MGCAGGYCVHADSARTLGWAGCNAGNGLIRLARERLILRTQRDFCEPGFQPAKPAQKQGKEKSKIRLQNFKPAFAQ
jgi:hypothetical protein